MDGWVAEFFYGGNADDQSRHALLARARVSAYVSPATVSAMDAHLAPGAGAGSTSGFGAGAASGADDPRALNRALAAIRAGRITHPAQLPGYLAENRFSLSLDAQRQRLLPLLKAQADPRLRDILNDGRAALDAGRGPSLGTMAFLEDRDGPGPGIEDLIALLPDRPGFEGPAVLHADGRRDRFEIELLVMGSRGLGALKSLLVGSVSQKVSHLANCTCITVK